MRIGSLCTGYGGLDMAVREVLGGELAWVADNDPGASAILAHRFPSVPNLGDITETDWSAAEPVDVLTAGFPCFAAGTLILTCRGYVPIENVTTDDQVLTHAGRWRQVTSTMSRDDAPLWRVKAANPIITTSEHPFYVRTQGRLWNNERRRYDRTFSDPAWIPASDLEPWKSRAGHVLPPVAQPEQGDGTWWWLAGRYLADGYRQRRHKTGAGNPVIGDQGRVCIACGSGKEEDLRKWLALAGLHATEAQERTVIKFHIINQDFYRFCEQFGSGASAKFLPASALSLPPDLAEHLLAGWLSGDGHQDSTGWHGTTTSKALALGMVMLAHRARGAVASLSMTIPAPTKVIEGRTVNQRPWWRVDIPFTSRKGLIDGDHAWRFVIGSESLGTTGRVYNISVAGDESYIADGVIVHNCQDISCAGKRAGLREGTRSGVWSHVARAIAVLRPPLVVIENVKELLSERADSDMEPCPWCMGDTGAESAMRALGAVLADLAEIGFDAEWVSVPAASAGACHRRWRVFVLAWPAADTDSIERQRRRVAGVLGGAAAAEPGEGLQRQRPGDAAGDSGSATLADAAGARQARGEDAGTDSSDEGSRCRGVQPERGGRERAPADAAGISEREPADEADTLSGGRGSRFVPGGRGAGIAAGGGQPLADAASHGRNEGRPEHAGLVGGPDAAERGHASAADAERGGRDGRPQEPQRGPEWGTAAAWHRPGVFGRYEAAVRRHEQAFGRLAPAPVAPGRGGDPRLSPAFTEWMMGLPAGWVTDVPGLSRTAQLKALGNGVVPAQAAMALRLLLDRADIPSLVAADLTRTGTGAVA